VKYEEVLHRVMGKRNILHTMKRKKASWTLHIIEVKIEGREEDEKTDAVTGCL
jgi:hypothetical protein